MKHMFFFKRCFVFFLFLCAILLCAYCTIFMVWGFDVVSGLYARTSGHFKHPIMLLCALLFPLLVNVAYGLDLVRRASFAQSSLYFLRIGPRGLKTKLEPLPWLLRAVAVSMACLAISRPQTILRGSNREEKGIDIMVALDLSGSMRAVMDTSAENRKREENADDDNDDDDNDKRGRNKQGKKGQKGEPGGLHRATRLDVAKDVIREFIERRQSDRIGVVVFGKKTYILAPPTLDKTSLQDRISKMQLDLIDGAGTAIGDALGSSLARLYKSDTKSKIILLLTDGDNNAGQLDPKFAAQMAKHRNIPIYTIQIGDGDDVEVEDGTDLFGRPHYVKERFPVNPDLLKQIAVETGGAAYIASDRKALETSMHDILDKLEKSRISSSVSYTELFVAPLWMCCFAFFLEMVMRAYLFRRLP